MNALPLVVTRLSPGSHQVVTKCAGSASDLTRLVTLLPCRNRQTDPMRRQSPGLALFGWQRALVTSTRGNRAVPLMQAKAEANFCLGIKETSASCNFNACLFVRVSRPCCRAYTPRRYATASCIQADRSGPF